MRTTLTRDTDVAQRAKALSAQTGGTFKEIVNRALRTGLRDVEQPSTLKPYRTRPHHMGLQPGVALDNVQDILSRLDGEDAR